MKPPIIMIGAGRSGTNILRDTLVSVAGWTTWDCDEINLIWRHGNIDHPDDAFDAAMASPRIRAYIRRQFAKLAESRADAQVLEKTCANSLRVPFIDAIFPDARYIYLVRDGRDVALSAARRWTAGIEPRYLARKLRYVPPSDVPYYALRFARNRLHQRHAPDGRQGQWGPVFPGMRRWSEGRSLIEICARQWSECVKASDTALAKIPAKRVFRLRYEQLVAQPAKTIAELLAWYGEPASTERLEEGVSLISSSRGKSWEHRAGEFTPEALRILAPTLARHEYAGAGVAA